VSLSRDRDNLNSFINTIDLDQVTRTAKAIARSNRAFVIALGGYNGIAITLAHSAWLHGYDVRVLTEQVQIVNAVSQLRIDDLVITISFWRLYEAVYETIKACHENGVPVVMLAESVTHDVEKLCLECIIVPAEAVGFQPSMTSVMATVHAIIAELVAVDPDRSKKALELAESRWGQFQLFHTY
jgi:DNA-binding MurR/RpiR family transcriptional regulator